MSARTSLEVGGLLASTAAGLALGRAAEARLVRAAIVDTASPPVEDLGSLHTPTMDLTTDDGTHLHVEVDETDPQADHLSGDDVTVIFSHGYCLSLDCWHYQRAALRGRVRMVFWDQRGARQVRARSCRISHHRAVRPGSACRDRHHRTHRAAHPGRALHGWDDPDGARRR